MNLLMLYPQWRRLEYQYADSSQISVQNCIKVLIRASKMYDAKSSLMKIIEMMMSRAQAKKEVKYIEKMIYKIDTSN